MMVSGAFYQVQQSLRWYVDRFPALAEWRATLQRVMSYRSALTRTEALGLDYGLITYSDHPEAKISIDEVSVLAPHGRVSLADEHLQLEPGERVLITSTPKQGKSTFFRALAELWPWGAGVVRLPPRSTVMFLPQRAYIPSGTLRQAIIYPSSLGQFSDNEITTALHRIGLDRLNALLEVHDRWDNELTLDEQQRLAFARALLQRPNWIVQDEAMSELDDDSRKIVESLFFNELKHTGLISIGKKSDNGGFYKRIVELRVSPAGLTLPLGLGLRTDAQGQNERQGPFLARAEGEPV
jgi:putative ATP-binding cassette transporter